MTGIASSKSVEFCVNLDYRCDECKKFTYDCVLVVDHLFCLRCGERYSSLPIGELRMELDAWFRSRPKATTKSQLSLESKMMILRVKKLVTPSMQKLAEYLLHYKLAPPTKLTKYIDDLLHMSNSDLI